MHHVMWLLTDPCFGGNCTNTNGGLSCLCPSDRKGHRCQYQIRCNNDSLCAYGTTCVETVVNIDGYVCDSTPDNMATIIYLNDTVTMGQLDEAIYNLAKTLL